MTTSTGDGTRVDLADMGRLADALVDEIAAARRQCDELRAALEESTAPAPDAAEEPAAAPEPELAVAPEEPAVAPEPESSAPAQPEPPPTPETRPSDAPERNGAGGDEATARERARLGALSLALTGGSREEARAHLLGAFGIEDSEQILDEAFGYLSDDAEHPPTQSRRRFGRRRRS